MYNSDKLDPNIKGVRSSCALHSVQAPRRCGVLCFLHPQCTCAWCKAQGEIASASIPHRAAAPVLAVNACGAKPRAEANIIRRRRGLWEVCSEPSPWREARLHFLLRPGRASCLSCNPRQREDLNKQERCYAPSPRIRPCQASRRRPN